MPNYIMDPISSFTDKREGVVALAAYASATDWVIDMRGQNDKVIIVKNTGGAALTYTILGSIDSPDTGIQGSPAFVPEFDLVHLVDTVVAPAGQDVQKFVDYYAYISIRVKGVGGIATIKAAATGN